MIAVLISVCVAVAATLRTRASLQVEILALRHQLVVLQRSNRKQLRLSSSDRLFWVLLARFWPKWRNCLLLVKPATVIAWHRRGFRLYWKWKSRPARIGRPRISREIRELIRNMSACNVLWGAPRLHGELLKLGIEVSQATVAKYMVTHRKPPSQSWRTFLENHVKQLVSIDFFVVPTVTFRVLFVLIVLAHDRRRVIHFNVTDHPTARWTGDQIIQAFADGSEPRYLLRDRDGIYGEEFEERIQAIGIKEVKTAPRSPWQNPFCERLIGSIRRDCLNQVIILGESQLRKFLGRYYHYYHKYRTHLSLEKDAPEPRPVQAVNSGEIIEIPEVGGRHHHYERRAA